MSHSDSQKHHTAEERALILGAFFHDIGKFEQRCTGNPGRRYHQDMGVQLVASGRFETRFQKILGDRASTLTQIIAKHHDQTPDGLTSIVQNADRLSASERVEFETNSDGPAWTNRWGHVHLASVFGKIQLAADRRLEPRYFGQQVLTRQNFEALVPRALDNEEYTNSDLTFKEHIFTAFCSDLEAVLDTFQTEADFSTLVNLLLVLFEKYMWCVPDFTGSSETDISLFNHLKDVAGFSHAMHKSDNARKLNLIIGDIPGIQDYIFNVTEKKAAKILRGRSIFVQVLARNFASKFLNTLGLTECSLVMLAGGKFYIVSQSSDDFVSLFQECVKPIENYLSENFEYELGFASGYHEFDWLDLRDGKVTFGEIIESANRDLLNRKMQPFASRFYADGTARTEKFVIEKKLDVSGNGDWNSVKCAVTGKPIRKGRERKIDDGLGTEEILTVDQQCKLEYDLGSEVRQGNLILELDDSLLNVKRVCRVSDGPFDRETPKLLINPVLDDLLNPDVITRGVLVNTRLLDVANFVSRGGDGLMDFDTMASHNKGAKYLTLIKGDVDNLGLIMAQGLARDSEDTEKVNDLTAVSRTSTLSNHLKYFFSIYLNGFLERWEQQGTDHKVYTVFAGGDDLMLICPQSSALSLTNELNEAFENFACQNPEIHASYSLTNFRPDTPIRMVAEAAEKNQAAVKSIMKNPMSVESIHTDREYFSDTSDKAGMSVFGSALKANRIQDIISQSEKVTTWIENKGNAVSIGTVQRTLELAKMMLDYRRTKDGSKLIWHPLLTYYLKRNLKDSNNRETVIFFEQILSVYKDADARKIEEIVVPVLYDVILRNRA